MKFRFAKEGDLSLREYVERKTMLLQEANISDETEIIRRVWENLDAILMNSIDPEFDSLDNFAERLYAKEVPARLAWLQQSHLLTGTSMTSRRSTRSEKPSAGTQRTDVDRPDTEAKSKQPRNRPLKRLRNCRHCDRQHFDFDCPTLKPAVRAYFVNADEPSDNENLSESDKQMLRDMRASMEHPTDSDESSSSKN